MGLGLAQGDWARSKGIMSGAEDWAKEVAWDMWSMFTVLEWEQGDWARYEDEK